MKVGYSKTDKVFRVILFILMFFFAITFVFSMCWVVVGSFRSSNNFSKNPFGILDITFEDMKNNYTKAFTYKVGGTSDMFQMTINSILLVVGQTALAVFVPSISGYVVAKYQFKLRKILTDIAVITLVVPSVGSVAATYRFLSNIGLVGSFSGIFLMSAGGFGFSYLIFRGYFASISWEYAEAAFIDGASNLQVFFKVMFPQAIPIVISIAVVTFIGCWNDYYTPYLYLRERPTVAYGVNAIYSRYKTNYPVVFAAMSYSTVIVLVLYIFFGKTIMESMSAGGIKG